MSNTKVVINKIINILVILIISFTSVLLTGIGMKGLNESFPQIIIDISLQGMHFSFFLGSILIILQSYKKQKWVYFTLYLLPLVLLIASIVLIMFSIRFPSILLFVFDLYIIIIGVNYLTVNHNEY